MILHFHFKKLGNWVCDVRAEEAECDVRLLHSSYDSMWVYGSGDWNFGQVGIYRPTMPELILMAREEWKRHIGDMILASSSSQTSSDFTSTREVEWQEDGQTVS